MTKVPWERDLVERTFCEQLRATGWQWIEGDTDVPELNQVRPFGLPERFFDSKTFCKQSFSVGEDAEWAGIEELPVARAYCGGDRRACS